MKAEELMIGDWVMLYRPRKVERIYDYGRVEVGGIEEDCNELAPIPLTSEILEQNFREYLPGISLMYQLKGPYFAMNEEGNQWVFGLVREDGERSRRYPLVKITYIHELQHALRLCGIEKEIVI